MWDLFLPYPSSQAALAATVRIGAVLVTGWAIWSFLSVYFGAHLPKPRGGQPGDEDEGEPLVQTRLTTVLSIVRELSFGATIAITVLIVLSAVGVDIGPLLAGFGIVGLALSFGSQALVKDIVSGIFFMTDDAFRVGEYIDTGKLRGTVERITLRSVQLRHQNGPVHTIPFGTIGQITNFSRDWATMKFTIRLDRDADIEKARKTIKKLGQQMLEDPELGPEFLLPLKMQGVQEITDSAIVIRCKFTAKPNKPTWLQREALKRIYRALQEAGVPFASNAVMVRSGSSKRPSVQDVGAASATISDQGWARNRRRARGEGRVRTLEQECEQDEPECPSEGGQTQPAECRRIPIAFGPPPAHRGQLVALNRGSPPRAVVGSPSPRTAQRLIGFADGLETGLRPGAWVEIWMPLLSAAVIRRPDLVGRCERIDAQTRVIRFRVGLGHRPRDLPNWGSVDVAVSHRRPDNSARGGHDENG